MTTATTTATTCRVRIVNHIDGRTTIIESSRDRCQVFLDLAKMVKTVNRRRDETLKASLHLLLDLIVLHWHCPHVEVDLACEIMRIVSPLHDCERLILEGGQRP
jgi:hypothetical protein